MTLAYTLKGVLKLVSFEKLKAQWLWAAVLKLIF